MLRLTGSAGKDLCDTSLGVTRRDVLRVGGSGLFGISLANLMKLQKANAGEGTGAPGWNRAKRMILVYLQGGPSHLDLWDPKENVPDKVKSVFKPREPAKAQFGQRSVHHDSIDELYAQWSIQSYRRHLSNDDRIHHGQSKPIRPT